MILFLALMGKGVDGVVSFLKSNGVKGNCENCPTYSSHLQYVFQIKKHQRVFTKKCQNLKSCCQNMLTKQHNDVRRLGWKV